MNYSEWKEINVDISRVLLDYDNPRVFIDNPTQESLLRFLIDEEGSIELANNIYLSRGLPPAEKPVVIFENGKYVVVEGNRRISACKLLYDRSLLAKSELDKVPNIDNDMREYLKNLPVVLAPNRDAAEPFITSRHAGEKGIKRWSTIATTKRYVNRFRKGESINHIARVLGETAATVRKGIRFFFFLEYVRNKLSWTDQEKKKLEIYKMETTRLDRFLPFSKKAKEILKIDFLPDQSVTTALPLEKFNSALKIIIGRIYLHNEIDTRSTTEEVFNSQVINICQEDSSAIDNESGSSGSSQGGDSGSSQGGGSGSSQGGGSGSSQGGGSGSSRGGGSGSSQGGGSGSSQGGGSGSSQGGGSGSSQGGDSGSSQDGGSGSSQGGDSGSSQNGANRGATNVERYTYLTSAYPFTNRYKANKRINTLIKELKSTSYKENRMGSMYLIRSLLETYTHEYIDHFVRQDGEMKLKGIAKERTKRNQRLRELLFDHIKIHLKKSFPYYEEEIELIDVTFTENNSTAATKIINFYIHSQTQVPDYHELLDCWKKVSMILNCLDEILSRQNSVRR
ncbi:hypothetical protein EHV15_10675 [Paenibacillus oralis]|uniref:ParB/Sulfiredoxin domain-containing protein n=1 Tax=Paenibacillus oralis TaxID=2490856 RepID=A0A3P3TZQ1_9BACL|nr:hypothetical protein [Paenibacillus oralis]RRJ63330.1 hypothetical protein EHV15_10675 [Paenibacillus oralis]